MEPSEILSKVKAIIGDVTGIPAGDITDNARFVDDLGLDSLAILEVLVEAENTFRIRVPDEQIQKIRSVKDSVDLVLQHTLLAAVS